MADEKIKTSIDSIEPREGARERMLRNIKEKAARESETGGQNGAKATDIGESRDTKKKPLVTSIIKWALPLAACLAVVFAGVRLLNNNNGGNDQEGAGYGMNVQIPNPIVTVSGNDVFMNEMGIALEAPEGATDVEYRMIDKSIAEVDFTFNDVVYTARASKQEGDFSGLYYSVSKDEKIDAENDATFSTLGTGDDVAYRITWKKGNVNYILMSASDGNTETMKEIYGIMK